MTARAGTRQTGWGQGACTGDYDNDGHEDLFVSAYGQDRIWRNRGRRTGSRTSRRRRGSRATRTRWGTGCAFLDYDRDGCLDVFVANYIDLDLEDGAAARLRALPLQGDQGRVRSAGARRAGRTRSTGTAATARSRTCPSKAGITRDGRHLRPRREHARLRRRRLDGPLRRERLEPGRALSEQARRHVRRTSPAPRAAPTARTASPRRAWASASATSTATAPWTCSRRTSRATPRRCTRTPGKGFCEDRTFAAGIGVNTRWLGWGAGAFDLDNDGWLDLFLVNGHVYPEVCAAARPRPRTSSARSSTGTSRTGASPT